MFRSLWKFFAITYCFLHFEKNFEYFLISVHFNISKIQIFEPPSSTQDFESNMFQFGTASSIVVRSLATWSAFDCQRNVIAIFLFPKWLIYGIPPSPPSTTMEIFLFLHMVHTNWKLWFKFLFLDMFKEDYCNVRKVTAALRVVRFFNRFSLRDGSLLHC